MAYLHLPRMMFTGDFLSDVSTVNNDPAHYNNDTFLPLFQEGADDGPKGWWNPEGGATFAFQNCVVKGVAAADGSGASNVVTDIAVGATVCGAEGRNTGKMVDLDPQWQMSSQLWGIKLRLVSAENELLFEGDIKETGFRDLQQRQQAGARVNGQGLGGVWTSVMENVVWGDSAANSPFVSQLRATTMSNKLSVNLSAYGYYYNHAADGRFSMGRIAGAVGPWYEGEPDTFGPYRRLYGIVLQADGQTIYFNYSNFLFEKESKRVTVDFSGSFPVSNAMGNIKLTTKLFLAVSKVRNLAQPSTTPLVIDKISIVLIGEVDYQSVPDWLNSTGGIVSFDNLPDDVNTLLENNQLLLLTQDKAGNYVVLARESIDGLSLRADNYVCRIDTDQVLDVNLYAYQWGNPLPNAAIDITMSPATSTVTKGSQTAAGQLASIIPTPICDVPGNNFPVSGLGLGTPANTDQGGFTSLQITGNRINSPRDYIDGQIYSLNYALDGMQADAAGYSLDVICIHLRDYFKVPENPTWNDISATMIQYANLYPIMSKYFVNLGDPKALIAKKEILLFAFSRNIEDPIYMPVTRDLSESKKQAILKWLANPLMEPVGTASLKAGNNQKDENPLPPDTPLTDKQQQLKLAVMMKSGALLSFAEIDNLFEF